MIDLNAATAEQLDAVPQLKGHGFEIVRYREERGRFDALRQLDEVPGLTGKWDGAETEIGLADERARPLRRFLRSSVEA
ncbi:MAG TPA: helix-hairpin-helix domain-containing protein [Sphingomonas sp.]|jgi:hypothetical protein